MEVNDLKKLGLKELKKDEDKPMAIQIEEVLNGDHGDCFMYTPVIYSSYCNVWDRYGGGVAHYKGNHKDWACDTKTNRQTFYNDVYNWVSRINNSKENNE